MTTIQLSASLEDYIEAIYHIITEKEVARGKDIATRLKVSGASVTEALRSLSKKGLINYAPYEVITMTPAGVVIAQDVIQRHDNLKKFFTTVLALDKDIAEEAACKVEHTAPPALIDQMNKFIHFLRHCPRGGEELLSGFAHYCQGTTQNVDCAHCVQQCLDTEPR